MNKNKDIIKLCENYYQIINFHPLENDRITSSIIGLYQEYIFSININDEGSVNDVKELDKALYKYINDYSFRKDVKNVITTFKAKKDDPNLLKSFIDLILDTYANYEDYTTRVIYISRWI